MSGRTTPAASTIFPRKSTKSGSISRRLQYFSTGFRSRLEQPDRSIERRRTQVHVALRRVEILVSGQFLDRPRRRATHRQMRTERVTEDMWTPGLTFARREARRIIT